MYVGRYDLLFSCMFSFDTVGPHDSLSYSKISLSSEIKMTPKIANQTPITPSPYPIKDQGKHKEPTRKHSQRIHIKPTRARGLQR